MCLSAAYWSGLQTIYFGASCTDAAGAGFSDEFIYNEIGRKHEDRELPTYRIQGETSLAPFEGWAKFSKKIEY